MNNNDFQRLLLTNDKALVQELTKPRRPGAGGAEKKKRERPKGKGKGKDEGKSGKGKGKEGTTPSGGQAPKGPDYRDRAKERREQKGEYEEIAQEFESHAEVSVDQSKYLGGDLDHTHLVKGLDFALLSKVRTELAKQQRVDEVQNERALRKAGAQKKKTFETQLGRRIHLSLVETLHPHHFSFKKRMQNMSKALALGQRIRGAPSTFLPGRMLYEFDLDGAKRSDDIPRTVFASKEDAPRPDTSRRVAPILAETVTAVKDSLQRVAEQRKQRRKDKAAGAPSGEAAFAVVQKVVPKVKAKDADNDIFGDMEKFDPLEAAKKARAIQAAARKEAPPKGAEKKPSYFADAGAEKYLKAPEGQLEMEDIAVDDEPGTERSGAPRKLLDDMKVEFDPSPKWIGARRGWVFKLGGQGLGYYREASAKEAEKPAAGKKRKRSAAPPAEDGDAYGELFPDGGLGYAGVDTGEADSDEEGNDVKSKIERLKKLAGKSGKPGDTDGVSANRKEGGEGKKTKMNEAQQWQKIDHMIKKGTLTSMEDLEARTFSKRRQPMPREIMSTPVHF